MTSPEMQLREILNDDLYDAWKRMRLAIETLYDCDILWDDGGKRWTFELKYRKGGKTLCAAYARPDALGLLIIYGAQERGKFEEKRHLFAVETLKTYDEATTYHDGKWVFFNPENESILADVPSLLGIKRKPNRK